LETLLGSASPGVSGFQRWLPPNVCVAATLSKLCNYLERTLDLSVHNKPGARTKLGKILCVFMCNADAYALGPTKLNGLI